MCVDAGLVAALARPLQHSPQSPQRSVAGSPLAPLSSFAAAAEPRELTPPLFESESDEAADVEPEPHCPPSGATVASDPLHFGGDDFVDSTRFRQARADHITIADACRISIHSSEFASRVGATAATAVQHRGLRPSPADSPPVAASRVPQEAGSSPKHQAAVAALALAARMRTRLAACLNEQLGEARQRRGAAAANADEARSATESTACASLVAAAAAASAEARATLQREAAAAAAILADEAAAAASAAMRLADKSAAEAIALRREAAAATAVATAAAQSEAAALQTAKQAAARVRVLEAELAELESTGSAAVTLG